jgi:hypothetical protein
MGRNSPKPHTPSARPKSALSMLSRLWWGPLRTGLFEEPESLVFGEAAKARVVRTNHFSLFSNPPYAALFKKKKATSGHVFIFVLKNVANRLLLATAPRPAFSMQGRKPTT